MNTSNFKHETTQVNKRTGNGQVQGTEERATQAGFSSVTLDSCPRGIRVSPYTAELAHRHDVSETGGWQLGLTPLPLSFQGCLLGCCPKAPCIRVARQSPVDPSPENLQRAFEEQLPAARPAMK